METTKIKPLGAYVLIENPLKAGLVEEIEKKIEKLPPKDREDYIKKYHRDIFENIGVVAVGPDVTSIKEGDVVVSNPELLSRAHAIEGENFLLVSFTSFIGKK